MEPTIEQLILASLQREISYDDLLDEEWEEFSELYRPGDELWYFRTPPGTSAGEMQGYALVRNDELVAEVYGIAIICRPFRAWDRMGARPWAYAHGYIPDVPPGLEKRFAAPLVLQRAASAETRGLC